MPTPAQIGAASAAIGGGALGGYLIANGLGGRSETPKIPEKLKSTYDSMKGVALSANSLLTFTKEKHLEHLLRPIQPKLSQEWWEWAYTDKYKKQTQNLDPIFLNLTSAYSETAATSSDASTTPKQTSLNQACDAAYKKTKNDYSFESNSFLLQNISYFCTVGENGFDISEPKVTLYTAVKTDDTYKYGVLSKAENIKYLVNTDGASNNNDLWWKWAYKKLLTEENKKNATDTFKTATIGYDGTTTTALNKVCDAAYKKAYLDLTKENNKLFNDIKSFCSVVIKGDELVLPTWEEPTGTKHLKETDATQFSNGVAKEETNKEKLIDPDKPANENWWNWSFTTRFPKQESEINKLSELFQSVKSGYKASPDSSNAEKQTSLNQACKKAYDKNKEAVEKENKKLLKEIKSYCSPKNVTQNTSDLASPAA